MYSTKASVTVRCDQGTWVHQGEVQHVYTSMQISERVKLVTSLRWNILHDLIRPVEIPVRCVRQLRRTEAYATIEPLSYRSPGSNAMSARRGCEVNSRFRKKSSFIVWVNSRKTGFYGSITFFHLF